MLDQIVLSQSRQSVCSLLQAYLPSKRYELLKFVLPSNRLHNFLSKLFLVPIFWESLEEEKQQVAHYHQESISCFTTSKSTQLHIICMSHCSSSVAGIPCPKARVSGLMQFAMLISYLILRSLDHCTTYRGWPYISRAQFRDGFDILCVKLGSAT